MATEIQTAKPRWDGLGWQEKEVFLRRHGFALGWSAHTWKYLDRNIQAAFESA